LKYQLECSENKNAVWIHASDGSTVGRFGIMGVDLHNTATEQMAGKPECRLCTHGRVTEDDWTLFKDKVYEWWGIEIPNDAFDHKLFKE
jgi:hypothetical protein